METPQTGYQVKTYNVPVKRYCQTLDLRDSPELIAEYRKRHSQAEVWPEILAGIREVGILEMEIYILGTRLFMIVETPVDFDWDILYFKATGDVNGLIFKDEVYDIKRQAEKSSYNGINSILEALRKAQIRLDANVNFDLVIELLLLTIKEN